MSRLLICPSCADKLPVNFVLANKNDQRVCPHCQTMLRFMCLDKGVTTWALHIWNGALVVVLLFFCFLFARSPGIGTLLAVVTMLVVWALSFGLIVMLTNRYVISGSDCDIREGGALVDTGQCPQCRYDLRGSDFALECPECGAYIRRSLK